MGLSRPRRPARGVILRAAAAALFSGGAGCLHSSGLPGALEPHPRDLRIGGSQGVIQRHGFRRGGYCGHQPCCLWRAFGEINYRTWPVRRGVRPIGSFRKWPTPGKRDFQELSPEKVTFRKEGRSQWVDATLAPNLLAGVSKTKTVRERRFERNTALFSYD